MLGLLMLLLLLVIRVVAVVARIVVAEFPVADCNSLFVWPQDHLLVGLNGLTGI